MISAATGWLLTLSVAMTGQSVPLRLDVASRDECMAIGNDVAGRLEEHRADHWIIVECVPARKQ